MNTAPRRRIIFLIASVIVSAAFLWLALRGVPLAEVWDGIRQANPLWIGLSFVGVFLSAITRAVRWRGLISDRTSAQRPPLIGVLHTYNIAMLLNLLPLRAGELGRTVVLTTRFGVPLFTTATSVVVERLIDLVMVVLLLAVGLSRAGASAPDFVVQGATIFAVIAFVGLAMLIVLARYPSLAHRITAWLEDQLLLLRRIHLSKRLDDVLTGLQSLTHPARLAHAIVWSLLSWAASLFTFWCLEMALTVTADTLAGSFLGVSLASLSIAVPVSVASIGPFESAVRIAGDLIGLTPALAITLGFLFHGVAALGYIAFGIISLLALGVSLSDLMRTSSNRDQSNADA